VRSDSKSFQGSYKENTSILSTQIRFNRTFSLIQVVWFLHFIETHTTNALNDLLLIICIKEGIQDGICENNWVPPEIDVTFLHYIYNDIKNKRRDKKGMIF